MKGQHTNEVKIWNVTGSFFWIQLNGIKHIFSWSTTWEIGDGKSISYWFDSWQGLPRASTRVLTAQKPNIALCEAWPVIQNINPNETLQAEEIEFTSNIDRITWRWEKFGLYTSKSAYKILAEGGKVR